MEAATQEIGTAAHVKSLVEEQIKNRVRGN
jgi:hypothetical protein